MWEIGSSVTACDPGIRMRRRAACMPWDASGRHRGFTILELMIAITIAGIVLAVSVPASARFYQSMQYRAAVRDVITVLSSARYQAINNGLVQDVTIDPHANELSLNESVKYLPSELDVAVTSAAELNKTGLAVIRFYPEGGSSGGEVSIDMPGRSGVRIVVDWLVGGISQEKYALN